MIVDGETHSFGSGSSSPDGLVFRNVQRVGKAITNNFIFNPQSDLGGILVNFFCFDFQDFPQVSPARRLRREPLVYEVTIKDAKDNMELCLSPIEMNFKHVWRFIQFLEFIQPVNDHMDKV